MNAMAITTTAAATTSKRLPAEEDTGAATVEARQIEGKRMQCSKCNRKAMNDGKGLCWEHGERKRCEHPDCTKFAKRKGFCDEHGMKVLGLVRTKCKSTGCKAYAVKGGVCIAHGAKRACMIMGCDRGLFKEKKCRYH